MPLPIGFRLPHKEVLDKAQTGACQSPRQPMYSPTLPGDGSRRIIISDYSLATYYIKGPTPLFPAKPMKKATSSTVCADEPHRRNWSEREEGSMYGVHPHERVDSEGEDREVEWSRPLDINQVSFQRFEQNNAPPEALSLTSNSNTLHKATVKNLEPGMLTIEQSSLKLLWNGPFQSTPTTFLDRAFDTLSIPHQHVTLNPTTQNCLT
ncbi:hypothetical protein PS2_012766 [Malus domestica]